MHDKGRMVSALVEFLAEITGEPQSTLGQIARRAREAGYLSQAGHGRAGAKATAKDAATILLVSMVTNTAIHAGPVVEALSALQRKIREVPPEVADSTIVREVYDKTDNELGDLRIEAMDPIGVVASIIDAMREQDSAVAKKYRVVVNTSPNLTVQINADYPSYWDFSAPEKTQAMTRYEKTKGKMGTRGGYRTVVDADGWILVALADWLEGREADQ